MADQKPHDGRFGEHWDDEIDIMSVVWVTVGIAFFTGLFILISIFVLQGNESRRQAMAEPPAVVVQGANPKELPTGPMLQPSPEVELHAMTEEMAARVHGYGWSDESLGLAYVPIEVGMERVLEIGVGKTAEMPPPPDAAPAADAAPVAQGGTP